jgi:hypothetical protein
MWSVLILLYNDAVSCKDFRALDIALSNVLFRLIAFNIILRHPKESDGAGSCTKSRDV